LAGLVLVCFLLFIGYLTDYFLIYFLIGFAYLIGCYSSWAGYYY